MIQKQRLWQVFAVVFAICVFTLTSILLLLIQHSRYVEYSKGELVGKWLSIYHHGDEDGDYSEDTYAINFKLDSGMLIGSHCINVNSGNKNDCDPERKSVTFDNNLFQNPQLIINTSHDPKSVKLDYSINKDKNTLILTRKNDSELIPSQIELKKYVNWKGENYTFEYPRGWLVTDSLDDPDLTDIIGRFVKISDPSMSIHIVLSEKQYPYSFEEQLIESKNSRPISFMNKVYKPIVLRVKDGKGEFIDTMVDKGLHLIVGTGYPAGTTISNTANPTIYRELLPHALYIIQTIRVNN